MWLVIVIAPLYYMILASFRTQGTYLTANPWVPSGGLSASVQHRVPRRPRPLPAQQRAADRGLHRAHGHVLLAAAFRIVRRTSRAVGAAFVVMLFGLAIPVQAIIVPIYVLIYKMHLYDTLFALILTLSAAAIPVSVLIMVSFVRDIPREMIGAMLVDGGSEWTVFRRLVWPLSRPVLATLAIYNGLNVWNNFLLPLVLTQSSSVAVLPLGLTKLEGLYSVNVPAVMAGVLLSVLPLLILFVLMRRQVMNSLGAIAVR